MAPIATRLTVDEYDRIYGHESGWEYWFGEARRKPMPTVLHGILQLLLGELLRIAGYVSTAEAELRSDPEWRPRPDVFGVLEQITGRYAIRPVDVVFEVLSDDDDILTKCRHYSRIEIPQVFVFDPEEKTIAQWDGHSFVPVIDVELANGVTITGATIWSQLEKRQRREAPKSKII